jgi:uracil-DNA glycosylase family 4
VSIALVRGKAPKRREFAPKYSKPAGSHCDQCPLGIPGQGYVPACGPTTAPILLVGESPWYDEVAFGEPFVGASGSMLSRILQIIGHRREEYRIENLIRCAVPGGEIEKWPGAVDQCRYRDETFAEGHQVVVTLGTVPMRQLLGLEKGKNCGVENFHGTVQRDPSDRFWVVPSYHPSHLVRGATNLIGVVAFDLQRAHEVARDGWLPDPATCVVDPPLEWFRAWAAQYIAAVREYGPDAIPLAVDIETPEKQADEGTLIGTTSDASYQITRVNLSCHPDEGVTVPCEHGYIEILREIFQVGGVQYYWYKGYDFPRLSKFGFPMDPRRAWDCMWMWKQLQSDLPQGLGFAAPFYSRWGAWKHLADSHPGRYAAIDGFQTRRVGDGCVNDLVSAGRWDAFQRHMHEFHRLVLQPATDLGLPIDRPRLMAFKAELDEKASRLMTALDDCVPLELKNLSPKDGLTRPPDEEALHTKARTTKRDGSLKKDQPDPIKAELYKRAKVIEKLVLKEVGVCQSCGAQQVMIKHRCQDKKLTPIVTKQIVSVTRWYWQEPFNPDSPPQVLAYITAKGHQPGKSKTTGKDAADREALSRLLRETGDPFYKHCLDIRAVQKIRGTYVIGTEKRLDSEDRVHPETTFKPSTMRTSQVNPNLQNVTADKGGKDSIAAGFRKVVVARGRFVEEGSEYADQ